MTKRLISFDLLKLFAIFLVLWGHCIQYFLSTHYSVDCVYRTIYSFHMPLFMMISGFFSTNSYHLSLKVIFIKKSRELLLPVLIWGIIFFIGFSVIKYKNGEPIYIYYDMTAILYKNLWFLKSLFICYMTAYFCFYKGKLNYYILAITLLLSQFIVSHNICIMYPAFVFGVFLCRNKKWLSNKYIMFFSLIIYLIMLSRWDASFWPIPNMLDSISTHNIGPIYNYLGKGIYRVFIGIAGSVFFITLFNIIYKDNTMRMNRIAEWGKYTLEVYILQFIVLESIAGSLLKFDQTNLNIFHFIYTPIISIILLSLLLYVSRISHHSIYLSFLLWGKNVSLPDNK